MTAPTTSVTQILRDAHGFVEAFTEQGSFPITDLWSEQGRKPVAARWTMDETVAARVAAVRAALAAEGIPVREAGPEDRWTAEDGTWASSIGGTKYIPQFAAVPGVIYLPRVTAQYADAEAVLDVLLHEASHAFSWIDLGRPGHSVPRNPPEYAAEEALAGAVPLLVRARLGWTRPESARFWPAYIAREAVFLATDAMGPLARFIAPGVFEDLLAPNVRARAERVAARLVAAIEAASVTPTPREDTE